MCVCAFMYMSVCVRACVLAGVWRVSEGARVAVCVTTTWSVYHYGRTATL